MTDARQQMDDHVSGKRILHDNDRESLEKKIDVFARKLETMTAELDDREVEKILKREQLIAERTRERLARREKRKSIEEEL